MVRRPSELGITTGSLPSITATHELVVPKSIPMILPMIRWVLKFKVNWFLGRGLAATKPLRALLQAPYQPRFSATLAGRAHK